MEQKISSHTFAIIVIGGSAGALPALTRVVAGFPSELPAAVFVVTHTPPDSVSSMPHILSRKGALFATHAIDGAPIAPGRIVVAPPNYHLVLERGVMRVVDWAKENGQRPSIDVLFRSAAAAFGNHVCGVLLSGTLDDGVAGLLSIRAADGVTIVQDPNDALFPDMPRNALDAGAAVMTAPADGMGTIIQETVQKLLERSRKPSPGAVTDERHAGTPSRFTCPDCGGTLWESDEHGNLRFRCRTGHAYNVNAIASAQQDVLENSLWTALRVLEERIDFLGRLGQRARSRADERTVNRLAQEVQSLERDHTNLRGTLADVARGRRSTAS
jgi:two-component system chemotaxis response regulator CheB